MAERCGWVPVEVSLPTPDEEGCVYLVASGGRLLPEMATYETYLGRVRFWTLAGSMLLPENVTHWRVCPLPPSAEPAP
jgi:hypothetical protein